MQVGQYLAGQGSAAPPPPAPESPDAPPTALQAPAVPAALAPPRSPGSYYQNGTWVNGPGGRRFIPNSGGSGGGGGGGGGNSVSAGKPNITTNTAASNPHLDDLWAQYQARMGSDTTQRAIDRSTGAIADSAALLGKDAKANLASRGALGSGVGAAYIQKNITAPAQRQAAGAAADITLAAEKRKDDLTLGGLGIARAPADLALQQQGLALQQYATNAQIQQAQAQQQQSQYLALLNMMNSM